MEYDSSTSSSSASTGGGSGENDGLPEGLDLARECFAALHQAKEVRYEQDDVAAPLPLPTSLWHPVDGEKNMFRPQHLGNNKNGRVGVANKLSMARRAAYGHAPSV